MKNLIIGILAIFTIASVGYASSTYLSKKEAKSDCCITKEACCSKAMACCSK